MKKRTRILAWLHILGPLITGVPIILMFALPGILAILGVGKVTLSKGWLDSAGAGSIVLAFAALLASICLINILPWVCLLKKRKWAWWYLTIVYGIGTTGMVACWIPVPKLGSEAFYMALLGTMGMLLIFGVTFLILITDRPKQRKSPTRRRRRYSGRRYARRRRYTYDY